MTPAPRPTARRRSGRSALATAGLRRRRQVDADRPPAATTPRQVFEDQLEHVEDVSRAPRRRLREPRAADRRPARRARAGHHDRRRLPLLRDAAAQVHHRRHARATCSTRATWSPARRPRTSRSCSSTRARASLEQSRRHAFIAVAARHPAPASSCVNKMDLVDYDEARLRRASSDEFRAFARGLDDPRADVHPDLRAARRQRRRPLGEHALVRGPAAAPPPRARPRRRRTATSTTRASRSSG